MEPLYSMELDHYSVEVDIISNGLNEKDGQLPAFECDILVDCMDKDDQPIFMYDSRGNCTISFQLDSSNQLRIIEIS